MPAFAEATGGPGHRAPVMTGVRLQILGGLRLWRGSVEVNPGPTKQALLLAVLLARAGRLVGMSDLIEVLWGEDPPPSATNSIHKYVGALRHLLEPWLPARQAGSFLHRRGSAYVCVAGRETLDLIDFRARVKDAQVALLDERAQDALDSYVSALALWHGAAGQGLPSNAATLGPWFAHLNEEFTDTCVAAADLALSLGRGDRVLSALQAAAAIAPLHERVQARLIETLGATGREAEALVTFHTVRERLADALGVDPGDALRSAFRAVLKPDAPTARSGVRPADGNDLSDGGLVGRVDEFAAAWAVVESAATAGFGVVVVEGEPGIGKTRLLEAVAAAAARRAMRVLWGRCHRGEGAPSLWPWIEVIRAIVDGSPAVARQRRPTGELHRLLSVPDVGLTSPVLPDTGARFRLFEQITAVIGDAAREQPVVIVLDDLHWADSATLQLLVHLVGRAPAGTVIVGALRDRAPAQGVELTRMLTGVGRTPNHRLVRLGALTGAEVSALAEAELGVPLGAEVTQHILDRTAGNPFFVRELARLLSVRDGGRVDDALLGVPATVVQIVRERMDGLGAEARHLLQVAAVIGSEFDLGVLARANGIDEDRCLTYLEPLEGLGLVRPSSGDPRAHRFAHDLVRESVVESTPRRDVSAIHLRVADALQSGRPGDDLAVERVAHHLWHAGPLADPERTADALVSAGRAAAAKSALATAERHLASAAKVAGGAGLSMIELSALTQLTAVLGMRYGYVGTAVDLLRRAETLARTLGREREAADLLFSRWAAYSQGIQLDMAGRLALRLRERGEASSDPLVQAYGWCAWGIHQWDIGNIGEAHHYLSLGNATVLDTRSSDQDLLRRDLQLLWPVMLALMASLKGDLEAARSILDGIDRAADDDPYAITVWSAFSVVAAALAGETDWARQAAERGIAVDPDHSYTFLGGYQRLALCWARAFSDDHPVVAADEAEQLIIGLLQDPPRSGLATWYALLAEMRLAGGQLAEATRALDSAQHYLDRYGQRYAEGLILLTRARLMHAGGASGPVVRTAVIQARALAVERGALIFVRRADEFLLSLDRH